MSQTHDHEIVSIYPFTDEEVDRLMDNSMECVLMWGTKDGWPVGVTHAFVWHEGNALCPPDESVSKWATRRSGHALCKLCS